MVIPASKDRDVTDGERIELERWIDEGRKAWRRIRAWSRPAAPAGAGTVPKAAPPPTPGRYRGILLTKDGWTWRLPLLLGRREFFRTDVEAAREYDRRARRKFGSKARLNFPTEVS